MWHSWAIQSNKEEIQHDWKYRTDICHTTLGRNATGLTTWQPGKGVQENSHTRLGMEKVYLCLLLYQHTTL